MNTLPLMEPETLINGPQGAGKAAEREDDFRLAMLKTRLSAIGLLRRSEFEV
jgi:hypothetical protein